MKNFWQQLPKPFFVLAPMDDVTDVVFRTIVNKTSRPDVFFTEFTNVEGLNSPGKDVLMRRLLFEKDQHPIVAQIWGKNPENYKKVAELIADLGFDGIDINMGCPDRSVTKNGCCSALINNPQLAKEIIQATKEGAKDLPVSVKTRIGFQKIQTEEWITFLLQQDIAVLTVHGRTAKEMSAVPAHWDEIGKVVEIRDEMGVDTLIVGNGDVINREDGITKVKEYGVDGIMIGRGIFKDLWAFSDNVSESNKIKMSESKMFNLMLEHARLFDKTWGKLKNFAILKKFFKIYVSGFENAGELREKLMLSSDLQNVEDIIRKFKY